MRRLLPLLLLALLPLCALPASAQSPVHLAWNDCGAYGQALRTFACNTNSGNHVLVASFRAPVALDQFVGLECELGLMTDSATLPSWWKLKAAGSCRQFSLSMSVDFTSGPSNCFDYWQGQGASGIASYDAGFYAPNTARIRLVAAIPEYAIQHLDADLETYGFKLVINNQKTVGLTGCSGCDVAAVLLVRNFILRQKAGYGDYPLFATDDTSVASWQCPATVGTDGPPYFHCVTPAMPRSWGRIKALYR